jgi:hypothetical protein
MDSVVAFTAPAGFRPFSFRPTTALLRRAALGSAIEAQPRRVVLRFLGCSLLQAQAKARILWCGFDREAGRMRLPMYSNVEVSSAPLIEYAKYGWSKEVEERRTAQREK